jgi:hypothetical protein
LRSVKIEAVIGEPSLMAWKPKLGKWSMEKKADQIAEQMVADSKTAL